MKVKVCDTCEQIDNVDSIDDWIHTDRESEMTGVVQSFIGNKKGFWIRENVPKNTDFLWKSRTFNIDVDLQNAPASPKEAYTNDGTTIENLVSPCDETVLFTLAPVPYYSEGSIFPPHIHAFDSDENVLTKVVIPFCCPETAFEIHDKQKTNWSIIYVGDKAGKSYYNLFDKNWTGEFLDYEEFNDKIVKDFGLSPVLVFCDGATCNKSKNFAKELIFHNKAILVCTIHGGCEGLRKLSQETPGPKYGGDLDQYMPPDVIEKIAKNLNLIDLTRFSNSQQGLGNQGLRRQLDERKKKHIQSLTELRLVLPGTPPQMKDIITNMIDDHKKGVLEIEIDFSRASGWSRIDPDIFLEGALMEVMQEVVEERNENHTRYIKALENFLKNKDEEVTTLNLSDTRIGEGVGAISDALKINTKLTVLDLDNNFIGVEGGKKLGNALYKNKSLKVLKLKGNGIDDAGTAVIALALRRPLSGAPQISYNNVLAELDLSRNGIGNQGATALAITLKRNATLTSLTLNENRIEKEGAMELASALKVNNTLTYLDLAYNEGIGPEGAVALGDALKSNKGLTTLDLSRTNIGGSGWINESQVPDAPGPRLSVGSTIIYEGQNMVVVDKEFGRQNRLKLVDEVQKGALAICDALNDNEKLEKLRVYGNDILLEYAVKIVEAVGRREKNMKELTIGLFNYDVQQREKLKTTLNEYNRRKDILDRTELF